MFIARSVGSATLIYEEHPTAFVPMPSLSVEAQKVYTAVYGQEAYDSYNDKEGQVHSSKVPVLKEDRPPAQEKFYHRPDHDIESVFWVLLATLLRAQPKTRTDDVDLADYWEAYDYFLNHTIQTGRKQDSRTGLLNYTSAWFAEALDPKLRGLAPMLRDMARQIRPEYAYLNPPPPLGPPP